MAQSQLALYNLAAQIIGADYTIAATSEESIIAETFELWYEPVRQTVLQAAWWNCAKRYSRLTEEAERDTSADWVSTDPEPGYQFSYELPAGMLRARYLTTFAQFEIGYETDAKILSCHIGGDNTGDRPILCYTTDVTDVTIWEPDLYLAIAHGLAGFAVRGLTGKLQLTEQVFAQGDSMIRQAQTRNANEIAREQEKVADRLRARGYNWSANIPYIHPFGGNLGGSMAGLLT